jgi:hypothetical protein
VRSGDEHDLADLRRSVIIVCAVPASSKLKAPAMTGLSVPSSNISPTATSLQPCCRERSPGDRFHFSVASRFHPVSCDVWDDTWLTPAGDTNLAPLDDMRMAHCG